MLNDTTTNSTPSGEVSDEHEASAETTQQQGPVFEATTQADPTKRTADSEAFQNWLKELDKDRAKLLKSFFSINPDGMETLAKKPELKKTFTENVLDVYELEKKQLYFGKTLRIKNTDSSANDAYEFTKKSKSITSTYTGSRKFDELAAERMVNSLLLIQPQGAKITVRLSAETAEQRVLLYNALIEAKKLRPDLIINDPIGFDKRFHLGDTAKDSFNVASVGDNMDAQFGAQQEAAPVNATENSAATSEVSTPVKQSDASVDEKATEKASSDALKRAFRDAATIPDAVYEYAKKTVMETGKASGPALRDILKHASEPVSHEKALRDKLVADGVIKKKAAGNGYDVVQRNWDHLKPSA